MTYSNANPITDDFKGPILTIASNLVSSGDKYTLQKYLILASNQVVSYTLNMCGIAKPSPVFSFETSAVSRTLKLVNSPAREGCATVNDYTIIAGAATCSTMAYAMKSGSTLMTENNAYSQVPGLQWKNASGYSICWKFDKTFPSTNLPVGTYSMVFTATYTITDDFATNLSTTYVENYNIVVLDCSNSFLANFAAPSPWITDYGSAGITSTIFLDFGINPSF